MTAPSLQFLQPLDSAFLSMDTRRTPLHLGSIAVFGGAPLRDEHGRLRVEEIRSLVESRLHLVPKLRKRVHFPLAGQSAPLWVDDPHFDITAHVRHAVLPKPGDERQLLELAAELMSRPLARDRPLWQIWVVDGFREDRVALVELLHHALADGLASVELATVLLDTAPHSVPAPPPPQWRAQPASRPLAVATGQLRRLGTDVGRVIVTAGRSVRHPMSLPRALSTYGRAFGDLVSAGIPTWHHSLNVAIGSDREVVVVRRRMEDLHRAEHHFGVTVNDLLLTAIAAGLHELFASRGEVTDGRTARILVPVGSRHSDRALGNVVSAMVVRVPVGSLEPVRRLRAVASAERSSKSHRQALATELLLSSLEVWWPPLLAAGSGLVHHQPLVDLVVTNVPGPEFPLYALGARMLEAIPIAPLGGNLSVSVAALSYAGQLTLGILVDPIACPDAGVLVRGINRCFDVVTATAKGRPATPESRPA